MPEAVRCGTCSTTTPARPVTVFPGTRRFACPSCGTVHEFEMSLFTKVLYGSFVALLVLGMALGAVGPGILLLLVGYAFHKNAVIAGKYASATIVRS